MGRFENFTNLKRWSIAAAKARFSEVIDQALTSGPQVITRHGKETVVIVPAASWREASGQTGNLADFFLNSPLRGENIDLERVHEEPRDIEL